MPVKYIDVTAVSDLFVAATRAYGDIAIIGKGRAGTPKSAVAEFTDPATAAAAYPVVRSVTDAVLNTTTTVTSATAEFVAEDVGRPVTGTGIANGTTIGAVTNGTTITLSAAATATATGVTLIFGALPHEATTTDLAAAIGLAFKQTPPPVRVWGVQVAATSPDWDAALTAVSKLDVQIVVLANVPLNGSNAALIGKLSDHVSIVSNTGGDGKERIGVAALDPTLSAADAAALNTGKVKNERMFLLAHRSSTDDGAAAAAGVIAGYRPHISMLLKPIAINQTDVFTDTEIDTFNTASINWVTSPVLIPGQATFLGEGYTADPSKNKKYIDIVRTIDDVDFRLKAALIQAIGTVRVSRLGLRGIVTICQSVLSPLVSQQVIEDFAVYIPLLVLFDKDPNTLSAAELAQIQQHQADRTVDLVITVVYAGAIHRMHIDLVFK
jgi:hypothetical protein